MSTSLKYNLEEPAAMASPWTDESAILRDLSFAQGRWVPGGIDSAVAGGKPPTLNIREETEEEYYQRWTTDGDFSAGPDLFRIKRMLELMQDEERPDDNFPSGPIEITKLNPKAGPITQLQLNSKAITFIPKVKATKTKENKDPVPNKPRRARNVAIASIMARKNQVSEAQQLKLCKPEHFMKPKDDVVIEGKDYIDKVTNWLHSQDITISSMFKKKSAGTTEAGDEGSSSERISTLVVCGTDSTVKQSPVKSRGNSENSSVRSPQNEPFIPSSWADDYYRKAVNRSHMRDLVRDDVWGRAEKLMKKIDDDKAEELRKQQEAEARADERHADDTTAADDVNDDNSEGVAHVLLGAHRHALQPAAACAVCAALTAHAHAPAAHTPAALTAHAHAPAAHTPAALTAHAHAPAAHTPAALTAHAHAPAAHTPAALTAHAHAPAAHTPAALTAHAHAPAAHTPAALTAHAHAPAAHTPAALTAHAHAPA